MIPFIDLMKHHQDHRQEFIDAVVSVMDSGKFILGKDVETLEEKLSLYTGAPYVATCASGTDALQIAMMALGIGPGDEVITSVFSFIAAAEAIALLGAKPVFVDIKEDDFNIDVSKIEEKITSKTKAIIPVSLFGVCSEMDTINALGKKYNITVIEDSAQSFGATYKNKKSSNTSEVAATSFFPTKPLGCYGDGGAIFTTNKSLHEKFCLFRNHGSNKRYHHDYIGLNSRLDAMQAAVLNVKLKYFDQYISKRIESGERYNDLLKGITQVKAPVTFSHKTSVYGQYSVLVEDRDRVAKELSVKGVPSFVHYPSPLNVQPCFKNLESYNEDFPVGNWVSQRILALPVGGHLNLNDQTKIVEAIKSCYS